MKWEEIIKYLETEWILSRSSRLLMKTSESKTQDVCSSKTLILLPFLFGRKITEVLYHNTEQLLLKKDLALTKQEYLWIFNLNKMIIRLLIFLIIIINV
jgi:hypothetical protein